MATNGVNRAGVIIPPSLPTIKESTLSWLGSELDSSIFSATGYHGDNDPAVQQLTSKNIQRCIDFDEQCLSLKSGEESEFSGVQPLPVGSDDTPPTAGNDFNRVVQMDFSSLVNRSENRPKPLIKCDDETDNGPVDDEIQPQDQMNALKTVSSSGLQELMGMLGSEVSNLAEAGGSGDNPAVEKLQLIRLWQLMQQEDLRRRQEAEIAVLNAQHARMKLDRDHCGKVSGIEPVDGELDSQDLDDIESGDLELDIPVEQEECKEISETSSASCDDITCKKNFDDIPVEKEKKSFEQLLEEELRKEEKNNQPISQSKPKGPTKRPFLRKGEGLARFKGPPVRKNKPQNKDQSKKQLKTVKPKTNRLDNVSHHRIPYKPPSGSEKSLPPTKSVQNLLQKVSLHKNDAVSQGNKQTYIRKIEPTEVESSLRIDNTAGFFRPAGDADLEEFEMLERYAEDDASFFNEPSLVASVLQQESPKDEKQMSLRDRVRERRRLREEARVKVQNAAQELVVGDSQGSKAIVCESNENEELQDDELLSPVTPKPYFKSPEKIQTKVIQRKTASLVKKEKLVCPVTHSPAFSPSINPPNILLSSPANPDIYTSHNSAFSPHQHQVYTQPTAPNLPADDPDDVLFDEDDFQDDQSWGDVNVSMNALSQRPQVECKSKEDSSKTYKSSDYMVPENEDAENPVRDTDPTPLSSARGLSLSPAPPPTSLMQKLFPSLKVPKPTLAPSQQSELSGAAEATEQNVVDRNMQDAKPSESQTALLKQKLEELENEISRFKKENTELEIMRKKQEDEARNFAKEVEEFRKQKDEELARLEEYKKTETKKLKKEKKLFEEHVIATKMLPKKEEREEISRLQEELENLRVENQAKEQKWNSTCARLRSQISSLKAENEEMQEQVEELETQRIKERKLLRSKVAKQPSVWETVNDIVDSTVVDTKKDFPKGHDHHGKKHKKTELKKTGSVSSEVAMSKLKDTLERTKPRDTGIKEMVHPDGKVEKILPDGKRIIDFPNGTQKEVSSDGKMVKVFKNHSTILGLVIHNVYIYI